VRIDTVRMDANGKVLNIGTAGAHGFAVLPWLPPAAELVVGVPGVSVGDRPGAFPLVAVLGGGQRFSIGNSEALYFPASIKNLALEGGRAGDCFRVVLLDKGEFFTPGQSKMRRCFTLFDSTLDFGTADPSLSTQGWEVGANWIGLNLYLSPSSNTISLWYYDATNPSGFGWRVSETFDTAGWYFRAVSFPAGRIFLSADALGGSYSVAAVAEVG
jgi:hypothetical protein